MLPLHFGFLGTVGKKMFDRNVGDMITSTPGVAPAVLVYLIYLVGIVFFVNGARPAYLAYGAIRGLVCYSTFELTNMSILRYWEWNIVASHITWGHRDGWCSRRRRPAGLMDLGPAGRLIPIERLLSKEAVDGQKGFRCRHAFKAARLLPRKRLYRSPENLSSLVEVVKRSKHHLPGFLLPIIGRKPFPLAFGLVSLDRWFANGRGKDAHSHKISH